MKILLLTNRCRQHGTTHSVSRLREDSRLLVFLPRPDTNGIQIQSPDGSFISSVMYGNTVLYKGDANDW
jgi:hypothetical protein